MELYTKVLGDPNYRNDQLQVDEEMSMMLTQIETLLFTTKGDVMGSEGFGMNLEDYVYSFMYNDSMIKGVISGGIKEHIPLSNKYPVKVDVEFTSETERNVVYVSISIDNKYGIGLYI